FTNSRNEPIQTKKIMSLCRCGASKRKPFCDGSHTGINFNDAAAEDRISDKCESYKGQEITINDNRGICSHAGFCTDNLKTVFRMGVEPWIDPDGDHQQKIIETIDMCPSGALSYSLGDQVFRDRQADPEIHVDRNGPYYVQGSIELSGFDLGDGASREHYTLCRCGFSGNKPRCDGSHWYAAFNDDEALTISAANKALDPKEKEWVKVAAVDEIKEGQIKAVIVQSQQIVLSLVEGKYGALDGRCPHQGGPLSDGRIDHGVLRCPWHGHAFNPITGKALGQDGNVKAFKVEEREDGIYILLDSPHKATWTISHVMAETMVNWGVRHVFGMVGHSNLGLAEAIRILERKNKLTYIGIRHEGAASFACSGYAKVSGKPAACLSIAGPGATNLLTGLWDAKMDRVPVLALTGQVKTQFLGPGAFQEIDLASAFEAVTVYSQTVLANSDYAELMSLALKKAIEERSVAHLIFPDEVQVLDAGDMGPGYPEGRISDHKIKPSDEAVSLAMYRIYKAQRPVIIAGYGARDAMPQIITFAEKLNAPVLTTFKGKGQIPDAHPLAGGVLGRSGTPIASWFMNRADLLIVFGASFSHHTGIDQHKPIIQVDFDPLTLGKFHPVATPVRGEVGVTAQIFADQISSSRQDLDFREEIAERWRLWRAEKKRRSKKHSEKGLNSAYIFETLSQHLPEQAIICLDVGNNTYSFGRYFECRQHKIILSGYLGSIGFSFPAAMGAFMARPDIPVISISGDGGFGQYMAEFTTAVKYKMNITHILLNNDELGKITKEQRDGGYPVWQTGLHNPDFAQFAQLCGGYGIKVSENKKLAETIRAALTFEGPALVEITSDATLI
ncbi:thiamine pyrophosphate-dependent enzyme, partial [candidate division CSSED10-310 bacterium]